MKTVKKQRLSNQRLGASHSLLVLVQIPVLIVIVATTVEINSMSNTETGLEYAAAATARSAIVHLPAEGTVEERLDRIRTAANLSFAPYCTGRELHVRHLRSNPDTESLANAFHDAHTTVFQNAGGGDLLQNKIRYARDAMKIEIDVHGNFDPLTGLRRLVSLEGHVVVNYLGKTDQRCIDPDNPDIDVRIHFEKPIDIPGIGRFMGSKASSPQARFYSRNFETDCSMTLEAVKSKNHRLGVDYDVFNRNTFSR